MPPNHNTPWLISDRAARDLLRITGRPDSALTDALAELRAFASAAVERASVPLVLASGYQQYRTGRPLRARLIVNPTTPPVLVEVRPDHEGRLTAYTNSTHKSRKDRARGL